MDMSENTEINKSCIGTKTFNENVLLLPITLRALFHNRHFISKAILNQKMSGFGYKEQKSVRMLAKLRGYD